ncbi:hypothetical protein BDY21DRAFT_108152 [Lineolata rhizophorae]|uniref:Uncharacterized protein n=1 Tax=Lineolata rhizophorae TaxID=578093 RepID=A0A6A6NS40_9PEZI|nr:hypothetical protein BDY21DRAFT_108152 [Lineolata rhizophorae]
MPPKRKAATGKGRRKGKTAPPEKGKGKASPPGDQTAAQERMDSLLGTVEDATTGPSAPRTQQDARGSRGDSGDGGGAAAAQPPEDDDKYNVVWYPDGTVDALPYERARHKHRIVRTDGEIEEWTSEENDVVEARTRARRIRPARGRRTATTRPQRTEHHHRLVNEDGDDVASWTSIDEPSPPPPPVFRRTPRKPAVVGAGDGDTDYESDVASLLGLETSGADPVAPHNTHVPEYDRVVPWQQFHELDEEIWHADLLDEFTFGESHFARNLISAQIERALKHGAEREERARKRRKTGADAAVDVEPDDASDVFQLVGGDDLNDDRDLDAIEDLLEREAAWAERLEERAARQEERDDFLASTNSFSRFPLPPLPPADVWDDLKRRKVIPSHEPKECEACKLLPEEWRDLSVPGVWVYEGKRFQTLHQGRQEWRPAPAVEEVVPDDESERLYENSPASPPLQPQAETPPQPTVSGATGIATPSTVRTTVRMRKRKGKVTKTPRTPNAAPAVPDIYGSIVRTRGQTKRFQHTAGHDEG